MLSPEFHDLERSRLALYFMFQAHNKMYKTLPSQLRRGGDNRKTHPAHHDGPLFGLNLNLGLANLISGGMNLLGQLRRKTPNSTPASNVPSSHSSSSISSSDLYFDASTENIELTSFPVAPDGDGHQTGAGHEFTSASTFNPTWCDICGDLIWGLYDTGATKCSLCNLTCHEKCKPKIRLNCPSLVLIEDDSTTTYATAAAEDELDDTENDISTIKDEIADGESSDDEYKTLKDEDLDQLKAELIRSADVFGDDLSEVISEYNDRCPAGQETVLEEDGVNYRGFIRVEMNLTRPINVVSGTRPPSIYNISQDASINDRTLTSFFLPASTLKALHITNLTTTRDVIRFLLAKFRIADNPHKYALYEKCGGSSRDDAGSPREESAASAGTLERKKALRRVLMRRLGDAERPMVLALKWNRDKMYDKCFVLQENDPGEISWDSFSFPELKNFLVILDREEAWYKRQIHQKYEILHNHMQELANQKKAEAGEQSSLI